MSDGFSFDSGLPKDVRKDLDNFRRNVFTEMYYLRDKGGKTYRVTNGVRVSQATDGVVYNFDLEAELFLSDSSPITITYGKQVAKGVVLSCEDFQISVILENNLGEKIPSAEINAEPWKLLESLNNRLALIKPTNTIAVSLMEEGPAQATDESIEYVTTGQGAAKAHARHNPITIVWGPPGTGKSHTMAEIAIENITRGKSVLIVSHSNISVDGVVSKVAELMRAQGKDELLRRGKVMRFGHVRNEELAADTEVVAYNYALSSDPKRREELEALNKERDVLRSSNKRNSKEMVGLQRRIRSIRAAVQDDEKRLVEHARLVATTASRLYANKIFEDKTYDLVMFDEVSMAYVPQVVCAAMHATERLVLVGDFRQLAPIAVAPASKRELSRDVFSYLGITDEKQVAHYHPWLIMLNEQRRMHPSISAFSSSAFYDYLLEDYTGMEEARLSIAEAKPLPGSPMALINLQGTACPSMRNRDNSRFNVLGAVVSFGLALEAATHGSGNVGIITPYVAQMRLIRAMLKDWEEKSRKAERESVNIACSTVHQFQGSERDVIVLDTVESFPEKRPGILTTSRENGSVNRLVNVAVTRARGKLITVSNAPFWSSPRVSSNNAFCQLIAHHQEHSKVITTRNRGIRSLLKGIDFGPNITFFDNKDAEEGFLADMRAASKKIVFSIPDGKLSEPFASKALEELREARKRGVEVKLKCFNWADLPNSWKGFGWQSDDAICPLAVIDMSTCWYGMPPSRSRYASSEKGVPTPTSHLVIRITGYATVNMICSLTELEARKAQGTKQALQAREPRSTKRKDGTAMYGLARYVQKFVMCPKCNSPMRLVQSRKKGNAYLRCSSSSCRAIEYLDEDDVNAYFLYSKVTCPQCKSKLTARLGSRGIYIRCRNGHSVKPNEI